MSEKLPTILPATEPMALPTPIVAEPSELIALLAVAAVDEVFETATLNSATYLADPDILLSCLDSRFRLEYSASICAVACLAWVSMAISNLSISALI